MNKVELLPDPLGDRQQKDVERPPNKPISQKVLFPYSGADAAKPDWKLIKDFLLKEGVVSKDMIIKLIK